MRKPMTIILIGALIVVLGGIISAVGTFLHNRNSSEKSSRIESGVNKNIGIGEYTIAGVNNLKVQNSSLQEKIDSLLGNQMILEKNLEPFIKYAKNKYPNREENQALELLKQDIEQQNLKIKNLQTDIEETKELTKPAKVYFSSYTISREPNGYKVIIFLKTTKAQQLDELEFTITVDSKTKAKILEIKPNPEVGNYYIYGAYNYNVSIDKNQAKLRYKPAGIVQSPNIELLLSAKADLLVEGNYGLNARIDLIEN